MDYRYKELDRQFTIRSSTCEAATEYKILMSYKPLADIKKGVFSHLKTPLAEREGFEPSIPFWSILP